MQIEAICSIITIFLRQKPTCLPSCPPWMNKRLPLTKEAWLLRGVHAGPLVSGIDHVIVSTLRAAKLSATDLPVQPPNTRSNGELPGPPGKTRLAEWAALWPGTESLSHPGAYLKEGVSQTGFKVEEVSVDSREGLIITGPPVPSCPPAPSCSPGMLVNVESGSRIGPNIALVWTNVGRLPSSLGVGW
jgi:hypothetical protein